MKGQSEPDQDQNSSLSLYPVRNITKLLQEVPQLTAAAACAHRPPLTSASSRLLHIPTLQAEKASNTCFKSLRRVLHHHGRCPTEARPVGTETRVFKKAMKRSVFQPFNIPTRGGPGRRCPAAKENIWGSAERLQFVRNSLLQSELLKEVGMRGGRSGPGRNTATFHPRCCSKVCLPQKM